MQDNANERIFNTIGCEWIVDAFDCVPERLREIETLRRLCDAIIRDLQLQVVGEPMWHPFPGQGGVTGLYLLSESHLGCHTYPEVGMATFNLYCCRDLPEWPYQEAFQRELGAASCRVLMIPRGVRSDTAALAVSARDSMPWESMR